MPIRENFRQKLITEFYRTLCGPYYGKYEVLPFFRSPQKFYVVGVLVPLDAKCEDKLDEKRVDEEQIREDDSILENEVDNPSTFVNALDSKSKPRSLGISFLVKTLNEKPSFDMAITWARYLWSNKLNDIKKKYEEEGIELECPPLQNIELEIEDEDDEIILDVEHLVSEVVKKQVLDPYNETRRMIEEEEKTQDPSEMEAWNRDPRYIILEDIRLGHNDDFYHFYNKDLESSNNFKLTSYNIENEDFRISFRVTEIKKSAGERIFRISVYFINERKKIKKEKEDKDVQGDKKERSKGKYVEGYIFQPQIRIKLNDRTKSVPYEFDFDEKINEDIEWGTDEYERFNIKMLYRDKRPYGRGHMCSAIWKEVDPERTCIKTLNDLKNVFKDDIPELWQSTELEDVYKREIDKHLSPFWWLDGEVINDDSIFKKFSVADIRTEYLPIYPINAPTFDWRDFTSSQSNQEFLDPKKLAKKCWNPEKLQEYFRSFIDGYEAWIEIQRSKIPDIENFRVVAEINIRLNEEVLDRMKEGISILVNNVDARMAFCFANKAIIYQYQLVNAPFKFHWRPFQIAFLLMSIKGLIERESNEKESLNSDIERDIVDLIWIPTGGGKTEAYLLLAAFSMAYRRRLGLYSDKKEGTHLQVGINIISRYTLRLLTIQQFRRGIRFIMSCELLRLNDITDNYNGTTSIGWLPDELMCLKNNDSTKRVEILSKFPEFKKFCDNDWIWGGTRFSIGLWIGGKMTPNRLATTFMRRSDGGLDIIKGAFDALKVYYQNPKTGRLSNNVREGDPAQIIQCPVCNTYLSLTKKEKQQLPSKKISLFLPVKTNTGDDFAVRNTINDLLIDPILLRSLNNIPIQLLGIHQLAGDIFILEIEFDFRNNSIDNQNLHRWWKSIESQTNYELLSANILNSGYFIVTDPEYTYEDKRTKSTFECEYDFEIRCLNPKCILASSYFAEKNIIKKNEYWTDINPLFQAKGNKKLSRGLPIHAFMVDDQIYRRLPTMIIGTVDKFAQIAYNDAIGNLFGNAELYHPKHGFSREGVTLSLGRRTVSVRDDLKWVKGISDIAPPEIILQDELHLIEGPLGSYVGIYEMAIDYFCSREEIDVFLRPKYIASTATIAAASSQIQSLYNRNFRVFPPPGLIENDCFFQYYEDLHPLEEAQKGRLYVGLASPGGSSQTTLARAYGALLNSSWEIKKYIENNITSTPEKLVKLSEIDRFWTVVGYFNTIKELARMRTVCNQDLREWMRQFYGINSRELPFTRDDPVELSSRTDSILLPMYLKNLEIGLIDKQNKVVNALDLVSNIVLTTSMFGTGVDISRLGVMVIDGQPKTTAQYIQASGRIGRGEGGIILTFLHAGRPRDLDHYEQFIGYHQAIYEFIEPSTVAPFAPNCFETTIGPVSVAFLRQSREILGKLADPKWRNNNKGPSGMKEELSPNNIELINNYVKIVEKRHTLQPATHKLLESTKNEIIERFFSAIEKWYKIINREKEELRYNQFITEDIEERYKSVVLGDPQHQFLEEEGKIAVIFENAPNSLRGVEPTICLGIRLRKKGD